MAGSRFGACLAPRFTPPSRRAFRALFVKRLDALLQIAQVVEILLEVDADARLLETLVLVETVDRLREGLQLERAGRVDQVGDGRPRP